MVGQVENYFNEAGFQNYDQMMESMMEQELENQQKRIADFDLKLDFIEKELNGKFKIMAAHVKMLTTQIFQFTRAVERQETLLKGRAEKSHMHHVILDDDFGEVIEHENLEECAFLIESSMSIGSSHWCRSTPSDEHRSTPLEEYMGTVRTQSHTYFSARNLHPPIPYHVNTNDIDRHTHDIIDRQQQPNSDRLLKCSYQSQQ